MTLAFEDGPHTVYRVFVSLNKSSFPLLWLTLEFFPVRSPEPTFGSCPRDLDITWDVIMLSSPTLFPASLGNWILVILLLRITYIYIYIYVCVCVCVCVYINRYRYRYRYLPFSGAEFLKHLQFLVLRVKMVFFVMLIR